MPLPSFPIVNVAAGSSIFTRVIGYHWTNVALRTRVRPAIRPITCIRGSSPAGRRPTGTGCAIRSSCAAWGPWMDRTLGRILGNFAGRIATVGSVAARYTAMAAAASAFAS